MKLKNVKLKLTGGVDSGRVWKGNVKNMLLEISKVKRLGWKPKHNTKQAIIKVARYSTTELRIAKKSREAGVKKSLGQKKLCKGISIFALGRFERKKNPSP